MEAAFEQVRVPPVVAPPMTGLAGQRALLQARRPASRKTVVAIVVGGWMKDQTAATLQPALAAAGIRTVSPHGWDDWKYNIAQMARTALSQASRPAELALIGHSFGAQAVCDAVSDLARSHIFPGLVALIDPVSTKPGIPRPIRVDTCFCSQSGLLQVYYRTFYFGPIRANIVDAHGRKLSTLHTGCCRIRGTHNSICHSDDLITRILGAVKQLGSHPGN